MKKKEYLQHEFNGSFDVSHTKVPVQDKLMQLSTVKNKDGSITISTDISSFVHFIMSLFFGFGMGLGIIFYPLTFYLKLNLVA